MLEHNKQPKIKYIVGMEPMRPDEPPVVYEVGKNNVAIIDRATENLGTYGLLVYKVYDAKGNIMAEMNAMAVAEVVYEEVK